MSRGVGSKVQTKSTCQGLEDTASWYLRTSLFILLSTAILFLVFCFSVDTITFDFIRKISDTEITARTASDCHGWISNTICYYV